MLGHDEGHGRSIPNRAAGVVAIQVYGGRQAAAGQHNLTLPCLFGLAVQIDDFHRTHFAFAHHLGNAAVQMHFDLAWQIARYFAVFAHIGHHDFRASQGQIARCHVNLIVVAANGDFFAQ